MNEQLIASITKLVVEKLSKEKEEQPPIIDLWKSGSSPNQPLLEAGPSAGQLIPLQPLQVKSKPGNTVPESNGQAADK